MNLGKRSAPLDSRPPSALRAPLGRYGGICLALFALVYSYLFAFTQSGRPHYIPGDSWIFIADGVRISSGERIYQDFFEATNPGAPWVYSRLVEAFGMRPWLPNLTMAVLLVTAVLITYLLAKQVMSGLFAFLPSLLLIVFSRSAFDPTHHWFGAILGMLSVSLFVLYDSDWAIAIAGLLCGLAAWFTNFRGVTLGIGLLFLCILPIKKTKRFRLSVLFTLAFVTASLVSLLPIVLSGGTRSWWQDSVVFSLSHYRDYRWNGFLSFYWSWPEGSSFLRVIVGGWFHFLVRFLPLAALLTILRLKGLPSAFREQRSAFIIAISGLFSVSVVALAPTDLRLLVDAPYFLICGSWYLSTFDSRVNRSAAGVLCAVCVLLAVFNLWPRGQVLVDLPAGPLAMEAGSPVLDQFAWVQRNHHSLISMAHTSLHEIPLLAGVRDALPTIILDNTQFTRPEQVALVRQKWEELQPEAIIWSFDDVLSTTSSGGNLTPLWDYTKRHYRFGGCFSNGDQLWIRNGAVIGSSFGPHIVSCKACR